MTTCRLKNLKLLPEQDEILRCHSREKGERIEKGLL